MTNQDHSAVTGRPYRARWWQPSSSGRFKCDLCPRHCKMKPGQKGFCYVREADEEGIVLTAYGRSSGFCIDPIEKKPLHHFHPGSAVFSFGTVGCNLGCKFCQNCDISKASREARLLVEASPRVIAEAAKRGGSLAVAYTYNDPIIFAEYAIDTAKACHELGLYNVVVTNGYITEAARGEFFADMDAANVDLKAFSNDFYRRYTSGRLQPVLDTLEYLVRDSKVWVEITTLLIPGVNDSDEELDQLTGWIVEHLGPRVPLHFSAFHPAYKLGDWSPTPPATLQRARRIALANGLAFVYTGNVHDKKGASTWCPGCGGLLIERDWYSLGSYNIVDGACKKCGELIPGHFDDEPGGWGAQRRPVAIS